MKYKILSLLNEDKYISGEKAAKEFNISRTAIWKYINQLKKEGYKIEAVTRRGYHLIKNDDMYNKYEITKNLNTEIIGTKCIFYDKIDSTNTELKRISSKEITNGLCVVADMQTEGKGRLGRIWQSSKGDGIYFSVCMVPDITPMEAPQITLMAGIAICSVINDFLNLPAKIKWPNDIIINDKKVCGILTEISAEIEKIKYVVCGIGINVNNDNFPDEIKDKATSLKEQLGHKINRAELLCHILENLEYYYKLFLAHKNISPFLSQYKKYCANIGMKCRAILNREEIEGKVLDIDNNGNLILEKENGERINIFSGQVTLRRLDGSYI